MPDAPSERPELKLRPEVPERTQITVELLPATKARLERLSGAMSISMTKLLEMSAANWEASTLRRLLPADRPRYLAGELTVRTLGGRMPTMQSIAAQRTSILNAGVTVEAKAQLFRYARFYGVPLADVIDKLTRNLEKKLGGPPRDPEPDPQQQQQVELDPAMAAVMQPIDEEVL